jgi:hypothetical protein
MRHERQSPPTNFRAAEPREYAELVDRLDQRVSSQDRGAFWASLLVQATVGAAARGSH